MANNTIRRLSNQEAQEMFGNASLIFTTGMREQSNTPSPTTLPPPLTPQDESANTDDSTQSTDKE